MGAHDRLLHGIERAWLVDVFFFFNDTATTEIYTSVHTLSLHDALPICRDHGWHRGVHPQDLQAARTRSVDRQGPVLRGPSEGRFPRQAPAGHWRRRLGAGLGVGPGGLCDGDYADPPARRFTSARGQREETVRLPHQGQDLLRTARHPRRQPGARGGRLQNKTQAEEVLKVDAVLAFLGLVSNLGPIREWGLQIQDDSIVVNTKMETTMPGVYAAGDVTIYPGKLKLIATGFGEAATAINNAVTYVNPNASAFPGHSSTIMEKKEKAAAKAGAS